MLYRLNKYWKKKGVSSPYWINKQLKSDVEVLDREYPEINIEFIEIKGTFGPEIIRELSEKWKIPINFMFIGSPSNKFPYRIEELGGVRLII